VLLAVNLPLTSVLAGAAVLAGGVAVRAGAGRARRAG
jgi:hypothetical protein